jgi:hypothetical protein
MLYYAYQDAPRNLNTRAELFQVRSKGPSRSELTGGFPLESTTSGAGAGEKVLLVPELALDPAAGPAAGKPIPFKPIGLGLPLTIAIREIYTGRYPTWSFFGGSKDMLVTSAVKSVTTYEAKPLALNFLRPKVSARTPMSRPGASQQGTPIVFYSPALTERSLTLDLTMIFDEFPQEAFSSLGAAFTSAAGIPIFLAYGSYRVAAGQVARLAAQLGEFFIDRRPAFETSVAIDIEWPGAVPTPPGFALITPQDVDRLDPTFRQTYQIKDGALVDSAGHKYGGEIPYILISLDGTQDDRLKDFTPMAVSAAVLSRFFGLKDGQSQPLDILVQAFKVYNDFQFRQDIARLDGQLKQLDPIAQKDEVAELKKQRDALLKNISNPELLPARTSP